MPELIEFQEVIESYPIVVGIISAAAALLATLLTRWVDSSSLNEAEDQVAAYKEEVRRLNEARAELLFRLEDRGDDVRRLKAQLARMEARDEFEPTREPSGRGRW